MNYIKLTTEQLQQLQDGESVDVLVPLNYRNKSVTIVPPKEQ